MPPLSDTFGLQDILAPYPFLRTKETFVRPEFANEKTARGKDGDDTTVDTIDSIPRRQLMRQNKTVRFHPEMIVHEVLHLHDYSMDEAKSTWYNKSEIKYMKKTNKQIMQKLLSSKKLREDENGMFPSQDGILSVPRGLESKTTVGAIRKRKHKLEAWSSVFEEQRLQRDSGISDSEALADVYFAACEICQIQAHLLALRDARDVRWIELSEREGERTDFAHEQGELSPSSSSGSDSDSSTSAHVKTAKTSKSHVPIVLRLTS